MTRPTANLRLFVAVYPPPELARQMIDALSAIQGLPPMRTTPPEQVHMTLQFIGDTPARQMDDVCESVRRSAAGIGAFVLEPQKLLALPERGPARLIAATTSCPAPMLELQRRLALRLARNVRERAGDRFLPHLTLARFTSPTDDPPIESDLTLAPFDVREVLLVRSTLHPTGARHHTIERVDLAF